MQLNKDNDAPVRIQPEQFHTIHYRYISQFTDKRHRSHAIRSVGSEILISHVVKNGKYILLPEINCCIFFVINYEPEYLFGYCRI
jgi:hypothetical protein